MSTRANIILKERGYDNKLIFYHHTDGYPEWMGRRLPELLEKAKKHLEKNNTPYWWDCERVGALLVFIDGKEMEAKKTYPRYIPVLQPATCLHSDIEYLWEITLEDDKKYSIRCFDVVMDWDTGKIKHKREVKNWRELAKKNG